MWPYSITIGVGQYAISVGTDSAKVISQLEPWRIRDVGPPSDYVLERSPEAADRGPRPQPGLYHGSCALLRSRNSGRLTTALLRVLASHERPARDDEVRVELAPVCRDGVALLAPPDLIAEVPDRWMSARGIDAFPTVSTLVDARTSQVLVDPPLGSGQEPVPMAFGGWWLPRSASPNPESPGLAVAAVMRLVGGVTSDNVTQVLNAVATLVDRALPESAPGTVKAVMEALPGALDRAVSAARASSPR